MEGLRLGAVRVSGELMYDLFRASEPGHWFRVEQGLPADAEYVRSYYEDSPSNCFVFVYTHPSFPLTRPGELVRFVDPPQLSALHLSVPLAADTAGFIEGLITEQSKAARERDGADESHVIQGGDANGG
jgi:hypothetical protein